LSDGAFIKGTTPYDPRKLNLESLSHNKKTFVDKLIEDRFSDTNTPKITKKSFIKNQLSGFNKLKPEIKLSTKNTSKKEIFLQLNSIYKRIERLPPENTIAKLLLRGSINTFFLCIARACLHEIEEADTSKNFKKSSKHYNDFIDFAYELMNKDPLKLDTTKTHLK